MPIKLKSEDSLLTFDQAIDSLADRLLLQKRLQLGSFWEFIRDKWSKGYERPEWFNLWHVGFIADECQKVLEGGKFYVCLLPRGHFKCFSTRYVETYAKRIFPSVYNETTGKVECGTYTYSDNGVKPILGITTEFGRYIEVTEEHPFLVFPGRWVEASKLKMGDYVASPRKVSEGTEHNPDLAALYGYMIGDGSMEGCSFYQNEEKTRAHFMYLAERCGFKAKEHYSTSNSRVYVRVKSGIREEFRKRGLLNSTSANKFVPDFVMNGDIPTTKAFLDALFICDGHKVSGSKTDLRGYTTISEILARDVQYLLLRLGIRARLYKNKAKLNGRIISDVYFLYFHTSDKHQGHEDLIPAVWREEYKDELRGNTLQLRRCGMRIDNHYRTTRKKLKNVALLLDSEKLVALADSDAAWEKITSIKSLGEMSSTAIESFPHHTLTVGGLITHNSTVLCHGLTVWSLLTAQTRNPEAFYLSYSDQMSDHHTEEIKKHIRSNPELSEVLRDLSPRAASAFRYDYNGAQLRVVNGGVFTFKRGVHANRLLIADDILKDPENPMDPAEVRKVEEHFAAESMYIPNPGAWVVIVGTPMLPDDLFTQLKSDDRFFVRSLPALDPVEGRRVLAPELRTEEWLLKEKKNRPRAFATEMMLQPVHSTDSFIPADLLEACANPSLRSLDPRQQYDLGESDVFAGFDIGKKKHPSHLAIYRVDGGKLIQIHESFLERWTYTSQVDLLNEVAVNFGITKGYYDNTRGEFEERGINPLWSPKVFTQKSKQTLASTFERFISSQSLELIVDERQSSQILSVNAALEAPETVLGHGDAFYSNALACLAFDENNLLGTVEVGDVSSFYPTREEEEKGKIEKSKISNLLYNKDTVGGSGFSCPQCGETAGWEPESKLCLICFANQVTNDRESVNEQSRSVVGI